MDEMMGAIGLGKSEGWAGGPKVPRLGRVGRGHYLALSHTLAQNAYMLLEVCGVGPDHHHLPSSSQQCPRETQRSRSSTPMVAQTGFPSTPTCFPPHR